MSLSLVKLAQHGAGCFINTFHVSSFIIHGLTAII